MLEKEPELPVFRGGQGLPGLTWLETCRHWKETYPVVLPRHLAEEEGKEANVYALVQALSSRLPEDQITVVGNGSACVAGGHAYIIKKGQRFITNRPLLPWDTTCRRPSARPWRRRSRSPPDSRTPRR